MSGIAETVCLVCNNIRNRTKQGVSFQKLLSITRQEFRINDIDLEIKTHRKKNLEYSEFYVNAYYDAENDKDFDTAIEVIIFHNFKKRHDWDRFHITAFLIQIYDAVIHEYRHRRQSKKRNHKIYWIRSSNTRLYLSDPDEIDAYAVSIAIELCRTIGKYRALRYMNKFTALSRVKVQNLFASPNLYSYVNEFKTLKHPVLQRLSKKVYKRLLKIDSDTIFM
jgi:hypothetical protein